MRRRPSATQAEPGTDLEYQIEITFWEAVRGTVKKLTISRLDVCTECHGTRRGCRAGQQTCTACGGSGQVTQTKRQDALQIDLLALRRHGKLHTICRACGGEGRVRRADTIEVRIPAGVQTGSRVRVAGRGQCRNARRAPGRSLHHHGALQPHPFFDRRGDDLYTIVPITVTGGGAGRENRSAHDRRARAGARSARNQQRTKFAAARKGRAFGAAIRDTRGPVRRSAGGGAASRWTSACGKL